MTDQTHHDAPDWLRHAAGWTWRILVVILGILAIFYATSRIQLVFIAVFLALVFTAVLKPVTDFYGKIMPRGLATALAILTGVVFVLGLMTYVTASVISEWNNLADQFVSGIDDILAWLENSPLPDSVTSIDINELWERGREWLIEHSGQIASTAVAQAGSIAIVFMVLALAIFCTVFFLASGSQMWLWFLNQIPTRYRQAWHTAGGIGWYTFSGYARGTVIIAIANGILAAIVLSILGVPLVAPLAVLVFIGAFIPLIGAPAAMVIAMVVALAANGPLNAALVGVGIALIGQFEGHILQPLIMGKQVSLHPIVVALSVTAGTLLAGILGAVIAVPLVAVAWAVFARMRTIEPPSAAVDLVTFDPAEIPALSGQIPVVTVEGTTPSEAAQRESPLPHDDDGRPPVGG